MNFQDYNQAIVNSLEEVWLTFVEFLPELIGGLVVFIIGLVIASFLRRIVEKLISYTQVDKAVESFGIARRYEKVGFKVSFSVLIGWLVKWFIVIATLLAVADILNLAKVSEFLNQVFLYIPNVIVAVIILAVGIVVGSAAYGFIAKSVKASNIIADTSAGFLASVSKWAVIVFALMAALNQLGVASRMIEIAFTGLVGMIALAGGLAFGLGGQKKAETWLDKIEAEVSNK